MNDCIKCVFETEHPWHNNGTPNMPDLQPIIDGYTNHLDSIGEHDEWAEDVCRRQVLLGGS